jgi:hypothetical protein
MKRIHPKITEKLIGAAAVYAREYAQAGKHTDGEHALHAVCLAILIIAAGNRPTALPINFQQMISDWDDKEWCDDVLERIAAALERAREAIHEAAE